MEDIEAIEGSKVIKVGWLRPDSDFETGVLDRELKEKLLVLCTQRVINKRRSQSPCELCFMQGKKEASFIKGVLPVAGQNKEYCLGSAEVALRYRGKILLAPDLIYHYVDEHSYELPSIFMEALAAFDLDFDPIGRTQLTLDRVLAPTLIERVRSFFKL